MTVIISHPCSISFPYNIDIYCAMYFDVLICVYTIEASGKVNVFNMYGYMGEISPIIALVIDLSSHAMEKSSTFRRK